MLPLDPDSFTGGFTGAQLPTVFGVKAPKRKSRWNTGSLICLIAAP
jgi:hypothetical protein